MKIGQGLKRQLEKQILNKALQHRSGFASTGKFVSCAFVVLLRKSIPQRATYKLPLNLALILWFGIFEVKIGFQVSLSIRVFGAICEIKMAFTFCFSLPGASLLVSQYEVNAVMETVGLLCGLN